MAEVSLPTPPRKRARFNSNRNPRRVATAAPKPTRASRRLKGEEPDDTVCAFYAVLAYKGYENDMDYIHFS